MPATAKEDVVKAFNIFITESNIKILISLKKGRSDGEKVYLLSELGRKDVDLKKKCYHGMKCAWDLLEIWILFASVCESRQKMQAHFALLLRSHIAEIPTLNA